MRAIHIDATLRTVTEIDVPAHTEPANAQLLALQKAVGGLIELVARLPNGDCVFVDEEGKLKKPRHFFWLAGAREPFAGNAIVVGDADRNGDITPAKSTVDEMYAALQWPVGYVV